MLLAYGNQYFQTIGVHCIYKSTTGTDYIEQGTLRTNTPSSTQVWCECDVVSINNQYHGYIGTLTGHCILTALRCRNN